MQAANNGFCKRKGAQLKAAVLNQIYIVAGASRVAVVLPLSKESLGWCANSGAMYLYSVYPIKGSDRPNDRLRKDKLLKPR